MWQGKRLSTKHVLFIAPSITHCPFEAPGFSPIPKLRMACVPHLTFLSWNLSCMWGSQMYKIKFDFSPVNLLPVNLILRLVRRALKDRGQFFLPTVHSRHTSNIYLHIIYMRSILYACHVQEQERGKERQKQRDWVYIIKEVFARSYHQQVYALE